MMALLGFATLVLFTVLVMTKRASAVSALILVPLVFGLLGGFGSELGKMMVEGIINSAPTAVMLVFALLYFMVMYEAGLFEPFISGILKVVGDDPVKIVVGTGVMVIITQLDGDGASSALITITAMYPIYRRVGINPLIIAVLLGAIGPVLNWLPWGGPAARAAVALKISVSDIVNPMLPALVLTILGTLGFAYYLGRSERKRLSRLSASDSAATEDDAHPMKERTVIKPRNFWFNLALTIALMVSLGLGFLPLPAVVMVAFAIAVTVNMPNVAEQQEKLKPHGASAMMLVTLILAAGAFTGILKDTGMVQGMADSMISVVPQSWGPHFGFVTALLSMPLLVILSTDSFFYGVLPVLSHTGGAYGVPPEVMARAALIGMPCHSLSPLIAPIYFVASLLKTDIGTLQRFAWRWLIATSLTALAAATVTGAIYSVL